MGSEEKGTGKSIARLIQGFTELAHKLEQAAETGREVSKSGTFEVGPKPGKGVFGFSVKVGGLGEDLQIEPFGNIRQDAATGDPRMDETREPLVDVFDEGGFLHVVAEMPGVDADEVRVELDGPTLVLSGQRDDRKYRKEIAAPAGLDPDGIEVSGKNGIVEIRCAKR